MYSINLTLKVESNETWGNLTLIRVRLLNRLLLWPESSKILLHKIRGYKFQIHGITFVLTIYRLTYLNTKTDISLQSTDRPSYRQNMGLRKPLWNLLYKRGESLSFSLSLSSYAIQDWSWRPNKKPLQLPQNKNYNFKSRTNLVHTTYIHFSFPTQINPKLHKF